MLQRIANKHAFDPGWESFFLSNSFLIRRGLAKKIKSHASLFLADDILLDFGCGSKPYQSLFKVGKYIGVDIRVSGHPDSGKMADIFFDGINVPLPDGSVDGIFASEVFEHLFDFPLTLKEMHRLMRPGAILLATCPFVWPLHEEPYDYARYTPFALKSELARAGFSVERLEQCGHDMEALAQAALTYFCSALLPKNRLLRRLMTIAYCTFFNGIATLGVALPHSGKFYLTNVIVAKRL